MATISLRNVKKSYGKNAVVHGVDLEIESGEFIVILGPSGCGKSTLLRMIVGLEEISGGEIAIDGIVMNQLEPRQRSCAMVFQNYALYPHMTVAENIGYALKVAGISRAEREKRVRDVAKSLAIDAFLDRKPAALSGGQRQRVAMGRAMIREPKVFLFDEPLSNLDAKLRIAMRAEIRRLHRRLGTTSIFVTHDQNEAMTLADRIVVMNGGLVEQVGTPGDIYNRPKTRFVAGFLGSPAMNLLEGEVLGDGTFVFDPARRLALPGMLGAELAGRRLVVGIRAEAARLTAPGAAGTLTATVDFIEELGAIRIFHTDLEGMPFAVAISGTVSLKPGEEVGIAVDAGDVHLYEQDTGLRIEPLPDRQSELQKASIQG